MNLEVLEAALEVLEQLENNEIIQDEIKRLEDNYKLEQHLIKLSNEYIKTIIENNNK